MNEREKRTQIAYDTYAKKFAETRKGKVPWTEFDALIPYLSRENKLSIVDIGCGAGRMIAFLKIYLNHFSYTGIDYSLGLLEEAKITYIKEKQDISFVHEDMIKWHCEVPTYDLALMIASFHHLLTRKDQEQFLGHLYGAMLPGGHVFLTNWNLSSSEKYAEYRQQDTSLFDIPLSDGVGEPCMRTYYAFTPEEIHDLFVEAGFIVKEQMVGRNIVSILEKPL